MCVFFFTLFVYFLAGIGSEEVQPFSMSLEAEMMLEQLKERHLRETEVLQNQLESKVSLADENLKMHKFKKIKNKKKSREIVSSGKNKFCMFPENIFSPLFPACC